LRERREGEILRFALNDKKTCLPELDSGSINQTIINNNGFPVKLRMTSLRKKE
jgi:hypothetical protein